MNEPIHVSTDSFDAAVIRSPIPVLVDFWAPWCGPCKMISPIVDEIAREGAGRFRIAKVNVDDNPALAQRFNLRGIPALLFFAGGELRHQITGLSPKKGIVEKLEELSANAPAAR
ncbi:MAG TPA: thioredoxin [Chthoniobacterales bacterium]